MKDAKRAEDEIAKGKLRGPLHGIPMAHKDNYDTKGITTTGNSAIYEHRVPEKDATTISKLTKAGSVLLGKLRMHEFASAGPETSLGLQPHNPWNLEYSPGGSSSGSGAAVAPAFAPPRSAPTPAAPSAVRPRTTASSASSPPTAASAAPASFPSAGPRTTRDR